MPSSGEFEARIQLTPKALRIYVVSPIGLALGDQDADNAGDDGAEHGDTGDCDWDPDRSGLHRIPILLQRTLSIPRDRYFWPSRSVMTGRSVGDSTVQRQRLGPCRVQSGLDRAAVEPAGPWAVREPLGCNDVGQVRDRDFDPSEIHQVGATGKVVVAPAGGLECDIECTIAALEIPHFGPAEGHCIVGLGKAPGDSLGADASIQLGESSREPFQIVGVGRRGEIDILGHVAFDIGLRHPRAISLVVRPPRVRRVRATCASMARAG